ncbi:MAG: hypothetical protein NTX29_07690 [Actinobacteria bacterium]|nr:hypothetical protein [Actinomycetota bacterium]
MTVPTRGDSGSPDSDGDAKVAVRQIEYWYKHYIDSFVQEGRTRPLDHGVGQSDQPSNTNGSVLAYAHEQAWRHAVVRAQRSANARDWAALTAMQEANAYESLLAWSAVKYRVPEDDIRGVQTSRGYRHHAR